jgi:hypothetical protein
VKLIVEKIDPYDAHAVGVLFGRESGYQNLLIFCLWFWEVAFEFGKGHNYDW